MDLRGGVQDKVGPVRVIPEDGPALEAAHHHVVGDAGRVEAGLARHWGGVAPIAKLANVPFVMASISVAMETFKTSLCPCLYRSSTLGGMSHPSVPFSEV